MSTHSADDANIRSWIDSNKNNYNEYIAFVQHHKQPLFCLGQTHIAIVFFFFPRIYFIYVILYLLWIEIDRFMRTKLAAAAFKPIKMV